MLKFIYERIKNNSHKSLTEAQSEMTKTDVLVCGGCNDVFHFMEQFVDHKNGNCDETSTLKDSVRLLTNHLVLARCGNEFDLFE